MVEKQRQSQQQCLHVLTAGGEKSRDEGHPDYQRRHHAHGHKSRLVKVVRELARLECKDGTQEDQCEVVSQERGQARQGYVTGQLHVRLRADRLCQDDCGLLQAGHQDAD